MAVLKEVTFRVYGFLFKNQLSSVEELAGSEVESFKRTIAEKDSEIAELSKELKTLQTRLQRVNRCQSDEEKEEEELHRLTVELLDWIHPMAFLLPK